MTMALALFIGACGNAADEKIPTVFNPILDDLPTPTGETVNLDVAIDFRDMFTDDDIYPEAPFMAKYFAAAGSEEIRICGLIVNRTDPSPAGCVNIGAVAGGIWTGTITVRLFEPTYIYYKARTQTVDWQVRVANISITPTNSTNPQNNYAVVDLADNDYVDERGQYNTVNAIAGVAVRDESGNVLWRPVTPADWSSDPTNPRAPVNNIYKVRMCYTGVSGESAANSDVTNFWGAALTGAETVYQMDNHQDQSMLTNTITDNTGVWSAANSGDCWYVWDVIRGNYLAVNTFTWESNPLAALRNPIAPPGTIHWLLYAIYYQVQTLATVNVGANTELHELWDFGTCSNAAFVTRATCEAAPATWTYHPRLVLKNLTDAGAFAAQAADNRSAALSFSIPLP